jgi:hypothetical protein
MEQYLNHVSNIFLILGVIFLIFASINKTEEGKKSPWYAIRGTKKHYTRKGYICLWIAGCLIVASIIYEFMRGFIPGFRETIG